MRRYPILGFLHRYISSNRMKKDVVVILGTTGVGKSNLAISLAHALGGATRAEIINTDAMQVYKALPILTAKVTEEEKKGIPHRIMSFLDPIADEYQVLDFKRDAMSQVSLPSPFPSIESNRRVDSRNTGTRQSADPSRRNSLLHAAPFIPFNLT